MSGSGRALSITVLSVAVLALAGWCAPVPAQTYVVDQSNETTPIPTPFWSITYGSPIGQEFRPTLDRIDYAEFRTVSFDNGGPTELAVDLYTGTFTGIGDFIASTSVVPVDNDDPEVILFEFPESIPLEPEVEYVLILRELHDVNWGMQYSWNAYARGRMIHYGSPSGTEDAWFREGVIDQSPVAPSTWGAIKALYTR